VSAWHLCSSTARQACQPAGSARQVVCATTTTPSRPCATPSAWVVESASAGPRFVVVVIRRRHLSGSGIMPRQPNDTLQTERYRHRGQPQDSPTAGSCARLRNRTVSAPGSTWERRCAVGLWVCVLWHVARACRSSHDSRLNPRRPDGARRSAHCAWVGRRVPRAG
jgi:hypothetical protein